MDKIRVLHVVSNLSYNDGVMSVIMNLYRSINKENIQFDFLVSSRTNSSDTYYEEINNLGGRIYNVGNIYKPVRYVKSVKNIFNNLDEISIIHVHTANYGLLPMYYGRSKSIKGRIIHSHNAKKAENFFKNIRNELIQTPVKKMATDYYACSDFAGINMFGKKKYERGSVHIVNNAIDISKYRFDNSVRDKLRSDLGVETKNVFGHVGRFSKQKNHDFLLDIFYEILKKDSDSVLLLIGGGELEDDIYKKVKMLGIEAEVIFLGIKTNVSDYLNVMDCFILPSYFEGLPVVGVEAQAAGLPSLFSNAITKTLKVNDKVEFEDIYSSPAKWATKALKLKEYRLENQNERMEDSNFNIVNQSKLLEKEYFNIISR